VATVTSSRVISLADVEAAKERIAPFVRRTPLVRSPTLSRELRTNLYLKLEMFQKTGAFKVRGAFNKMLSLKAAAAKRGVVAVSGGNHAQGVAHAARTLGLSALILMPEHTPTNYLEATRRYGADIKLVSTMAEAFEQVRHFEANGWIQIHPFDDPLVMAGQGTIALEMLEDIAELTDIVVSIGGGGLMSGVVTAVKALKPGVRIWGVETAGANSMACSLAAGRVVELDKVQTIARTLAVPAVAETALRLANEHLESVTVVTDEETLDALRFLLERVKVLAEPAAACTLAAAKLLDRNFSEADHVALVLCGGNFAVDDLCQCQVPLSPMREPFPMPLLH
jgi:threonine dehydratase